MPIYFFGNDIPVVVIIYDFIKLGEFSLYGYIYWTVMRNHIRLYAQLKTPRLGKLVMDFKTVFLPIETLYFCKIGAFFLGEFSFFKSSFPFPLTKSVQFLFASYVNAFATTLFLLLELACIGILIGVDFLQKCREKFGLLALSHIFPEYKKSHITLLVRFFERHKRQFTALFKECFLAFDTFSQILLVVFSSNALARTQIAEARNAFGGNI